MALFEPWFILAAVSQRQVDAKANPINSRWIDPNFMAYIPAALIGMLLGRRKMKTVKKWQWQSKE